MVSPVSGTYSTTDLELLSNWMNLVPSISPVVESLTIVLRVPELLPPLTAITRAKVLLGSNWVGSGTGVSGMRRVVLLLSSGIDRRPTVGSGVTVPPVPLEAGVSAGTGVSVGSGASLVACLVLSGITSVGSVAGSSTAQAANNRRSAPRSRVTFQVLKIFTITPPWSGCRTLVSDGYGRPFNHRLILMVNQSTSRKPWRRSHILSRF